MKLILLIFLHLIYCRYENTPIEHELIFCNDSSYVLPKYDCGYILQKGIDSCMHLVWYTDCNISNIYNWHWHTRSICNADLSKCVHNISSNNNYFEFEIIDVMNKTLVYDIQSNKKSLFDIFDDVNKDNIYVFVIGVSGFFIFFLCIGVKVFYIQEERRLLT